MPRSASSRPASIRAPATSTRGRGREVQHQQLERRRRGADPLPDRLPHVLDVEVEQRRLDANEERSGHRLVVRVAFQVRVGPGAGDAAEEGDVRVRRAPDEQAAARPPPPASRPSGCRAPARRRTRPSTRRTRNGSPARAWRSSPDVDQPLDRHQHDRREDHVRQVGQHAGQEQQAERRSSSEANTSAAASSRRPCRSPRTATARRPPGRPGRAPRPGSPRRGRAAPGAGRSRSRASAPARAPPRRFPRTRAAGRRRPAGMTPVHVARPQRRQLEVGQARRQRADDLEAESRRASVTDSSDDREPPPRERDRSARQESLAEQQHARCAATPKPSTARLVSGSWPPRTTRRSKKPLRRP